MSFAKDTSCTDGRCEISSGSLEAQRVYSLSDEISLLCQSLGRERNSCRILPVTKTIAPEVLIGLCKNKILTFGENKVQELKSKYSRLANFSPTWHFIGHLQTNKVRECVERVTLIHSIDRLDLAIKLDSELEKLGRSMNVLIQVNTSGEPSKFGVKPEATKELVKKIKDLQSLKIKGLMTLAIFSSEEKRVRKCFRDLRELSECIEAEGYHRVEMNELSMGMSSDYRIAIEEGATIVRLGQTIFGPRNTPDSFYWDENK